MASDYRTELIASAAIAANGDSTSDKKTLPPQSRHQIALITVSGRTDGTFTLKIEHSADGTNYEQIAAGAGLSADGVESVDLPDRHLPYVRCVITASAITVGATGVKAEMFSNITRS